MNTVSTHKPHKISLIRPFALTALILLVPLLAMQFDWRFPDPGSSSSDRVNWDLFDFIVMGTLLLSTGLTYEVAAKKVSNFQQRAVIGIALLAALFLIWAELAVGIFGSPFAGS